MDVYNLGNCGAEVRRGEPILVLILTIIPKTQGAALAAAGSGGALKATGIPPFPPRAATPTPKSPLLPLLPAELIPHRGRNTSWDFSDRDRGDFLPAAEGKGLV